MEQEPYQILDVGELLANYATVSQNKYGFFLCRKGEADILLNDHSFHIETGFLCLYTPYTFIRIVRHSDDIAGYLIEGKLDTIQAALSNIPAVERFAIRSHPCVKLTMEQYQRLEQDVEMLNARTALAMQSNKPHSLRLLHLLVQTLLQAFCLEVLEIYFNCMPIEELPQNREEKNIQQLPYVRLPQLCKRAFCHLLCPRTKSIAQLFIIRCQSQVRTHCHAMDRDVYHFASPTFSKTDKTQH